MGMRTEATASLPRLLGPFLIAIRTMTVIGIANIMVSNTNEYYNNARRFSNICPELLKRLHACISFSRHVRLSLQGRDWGCNRLEVGHSRYACTDPVESQGQTLSTNP